MYLNNIEKEFSILKKDMGEWIKNGDCDKLAKKSRIKFAKLPYNLKLTENNPKNGNFTQQLLLVHSMFFKRLIAS
jgi:hypothetical protein